VNGAAAYHFHVATDTDFNVIIDQKVIDNNPGGNGYTAQAPLTSGTTLYWRVHAIDVYGNIGAWSGTRTLTINP
jgi:hypothetical protein